ncbi:MAG: phosphate ABC transporter permease PstA [Actinobacteria bacterium]|nr:phosphate ABC transporter permease PstA [Actinomycetota bacterium]
MAARAATPSTADLVRQSIQGRRLGFGDIAFPAALLLALLFALLFLATLLVDIFAKSWSALSGRGWSVVSNPLTLNAETAGLWQSIMGSLGLVAVVALLAFPIGISAAVYLEEYAPDNRFTRLVNTNIRNLAGVPSIVYGILGFTIFVRFIRAVGAGGGVGGKNLLAGGLTLAALVLPIVIITSAEALRAVPQSIREAGFGVGATRWEVIRYHVVPYAAPGILTGTVLTLARAFGETAPLLLVGAATGFFSTGSGNLIDKTLGPYTALPVTIFSWARQPGADFRSLTAAAIVVLLVVLLTANAAAIILRNRYERKW